MSMKIPFHSIAGNETEVPKVKVTPRYSMNETNFHQSKSQIPASMGYILP